MAREKVITLNILNIASNPIHSPQMYHDSFKAIYTKKTVAKISGEKFGSLNSLKYFDSNKPLSGMYGSFYKFTKIQLDHWYDLLQEKYASDEQLKSIKIPANLVPNAEKFFYFFFPEHHRLVFQSSESGKKFSPRLAAKMFAGLFNDLKISDKGTFITVTLEQSEKSLTNIYSIPALTKMDILINRPNADLDDVDEAVVFKRMEDQNLKRWETKIRAPNKENISPDDETKRLARVALSNGKVDAIGYDENGLKIEESTIDHPITEQYTLNPQKEDSMSKFLLKAREFLSSFLG